MSKITFAEDAWELKKVVWPTPQKVAKNTGTVLLCSLVIGACIWVFLPFHISRRPPPVTIASLLRKQPVPPRVEAKTRKKKHLFPQVNLTISHPSRLVNWFLKFFSPEFLHFSRQPRGSSSSGDEQVLPLLQEAYGPLGD